jgi:hypothetical protein
MAVIGHLFSYKPEVVAEISKKLSKCHGQTCSLSSSSA